MGSKKRIKKYIQNEEEIEEFPTILIQLSFISAHFPCHCVYIREAKIIV